MLKVGIAFKNLGLNYSRRPTSFRYFKLSHTSVNTPFYSLDHFIFKMSPFFNYIFFAKLVKLPKLNPCNILC